MATVNHATWLSGGGATGGGSSAGGLFFTTGANQYAIITYTSPGSSDGIFIGSSEVMAPSFGAIYVPPSVSVTAAATGNYYFTWVIFNSQ